MVVFIGDKMGTNDFLPLPPPSLYPATHIPLVPVFELCNELIWELSQVKKITFLH